MEYAIIGIFHHRMGGAVVEIHLQSVLALIWVPLYLFLACYYLVFHFRDRLRHHLLFAFLWFCWAIYAMGSGGL